MKFKKAQGFSINKLIVVILVVLVILSVLMFIFKSDINSYIRHLPGYSASNEDETIDLSELEDAKIVAAVCPEKIARVLGDLVYSCTGESCDKLDKTSFLWYGDSKTADIFVDQYVNNRIGIVRHGIVEIFPDVFDTTSSLYKEVKEDLPGFEFLYNFDGVSLFPGNWLCRKEKVKYEPLTQQIIDLNEDYRTLFKVTDKDGKIKILGGECINSRTKPLQIFLDNEYSWGGSYIDFVWDERDKNAYARDIGTNNFLDFRDISGKKSVCYKYFKGMDEDELDFENVLMILSSPTFKDFAEKILKVHKSSGNYIINGEHFTTVNHIFEKVMQEDYEKDWLNPGECKTKKVVYSCPILGEGKECNVEEKNKFCIIDAQEKICGETCFCTENYGEGDMFFFKIGDQEWVFKISEEGYSKRCVSDNCKTADRMEVKI